MQLSTTRIIELIVAVSVVVISVASLFVAVFQGRVMQRTLEASVVPVMQYGSGNYDLETGEWAIKIEFKNTGLGPAELRWVDIRWNGESIANTSLFMSQCCLPEDLEEAERLPYLYQAFESGQLNLVFDDVQGRFFAPQESVDFVTFPRPDEETQPVGYAIWQAVDDARHDLEVEICYCSVFDDCWQSTYPNQTRERVRQCPVTQVD